LIYALITVNFKEEWWLEVTEKSTSREGSCVGEICGDSARGFQTDIENNAKLVKDCGDLIV